MWHLSLHTDSNHRLIAGYVSWSAVRISPGSLTELVFNVANKGEVKYKALIWDTMTLETAGKLPGGMLFSIDCPPDSISQVHLPHCEPEPGKNTTEPCDHPLKQAEIVVFFFYLLQVCMKLS